MASVIQVETTETVAIACPSGTVEGDIVRNGSIVGVALLDRYDSAYTVIKINRTFILRKAVQALSTVGSAGSASAVALGDKLYRDTASQIISKDSSGYFIGYALGVPDTAAAGGGAYAAGTQIAAGSTATIDILYEPSGS